jgi:tetratricopeptide (TPR) repeat protein
MQSEKKRLLFVVPFVAAVSVVWGAVLAQEETPETPVQPVPEESVDAVEDELREEIRAAKELVREANYADAVPALAKLVEARPDDVELVSLYGEVLLAKGSADQAVPVLENAIGLAPEQPRLHFQLAAARLAIGELDGALEAFGEEIAVNEDTEVRRMAHLNRFILHRNKKQWAEAAVDLEAAIAIKEESPQVYADLSDLYLQAREPDKAMDALRRGEERGFKSAALYFNIGAWLYNEKKYAEAMAAFEKTIEISPEMATAHRGIASSLVQLDRTSDAVPHYRRYLELRPDAEDADEIRQTIEDAESP